MRTQVEDLEGQVSTLNEQLESLTWELERERAKNRTLPNGTPEVDSPEYAAKYMKIDELGLADDGICGILRYRHIETVGELIALSKKEIRKMRIYPKRIAEIEEKLAVYGLSLKND